MKKIVGFLLVFSVLLTAAIFAEGCFFASAQNSSCQFETKSSLPTEKGCLLSEVLFEQEEQSDFETYVVTANSAVVFSRSDFASEKIATLKHKKELFVLTNSGTPVTEFWGNFKFFKISLLDNEIENDNFDFGYVFADLLTKKQDEIVAIPNFNAKTNKECHVFFQENGTFVESKTLLLRGQGIFLYEGFDAKKDFNAISYVFDGKVLYGFLKTEDINPNGINPVLITCIILIVAVLSIIFTWLFMKTKHVHLKKQKK